MQHTLLLDASDVASWTPLHIAAHMGRREVALRLLQANASPTWRNVRGQTPLDLCMDHGTLEVIRAAVPPKRSSSVLDNGTGISALSAVAVAEDSVGIPLRCEPECFFVNPAPIFRGTTQHRKQMLHIAALIFNLKPSYGLAFSVVSGLVDSYTGAMRLFLQRGGACRVALGGFLGEAFSLCTLIRFSVFDSMPLLHTGVLAALSRAFSVVQLPEDLMKIDRLVRGLAHVWWRKHKALAEGLTENPSPAQQQQLALQQQRYQVLSLQGGTADSGEMPELAGLELWQYLAGSDALCQLMLSTVLLHWLVHANGTGPGRPMPVEDWMALNRGIEGSGGDVPEHIQRRIHFLVCKRFRLELTLAHPSSQSPPSSPSPSAGSGAPVVKTTAPPLPASADSAAAARLATAIAERAAVAAEQAAEVAAAAAAAAAFYSTSLPGTTMAQRQSGASNPPSPQRPGAPVLSSCAIAEGWVQLLDGVLPCPESPAREGVSERTSMPGIAQGFALSNDRSGAQGDQRRSGEAAVARASAAAASAAAALKVPVGEGGAVEGAVWASLCSIFLFFSVSNGTDASSAPYVMADARNLHVANVNSESLTISLEAIPGREGQRTPMTWVLLLPDGRWQEVYLARVDFKVGSAQDLQHWVSNLVQWPANQPPTLHHSV